MSVKQGMELGAPQTVAAIYIQETLPMLPSIAPQAHIEFEKEGSVLAIIFTSYLIVREARIILQILFYCQKRLHRKKTSRT